MFWLVERNDDKHASGICTRSASQKSCDSNFNTTLAYNRSLSAKMSAPGSGQALGTAPAKFIACGMRRDLSLQARARFARLDREQRAVAACKKEAQNRLPCRLPDNSICACSDKNPQAEGPRTRHESSSPEHHLPKARGTSKDPRLTLRDWLQAGS